MPSRDQWAYCSSQEPRHAARVQGRSVGRVGSDAPRSRNLRGRAADARVAVWRTAIQDQGAVERHRSRRARGRDQEEPTPAPPSASVSASLGPLAWGQLKLGTNFRSSPKPTRRANQPEFVNNSPLSAEAPGRSPDGSPTG